ncbi:MAG: helix-turn-helix transcriptional regulator [Cytophagales bacterium]|nr:helix-turn-helix transcriptional regulator [Armatimonadota bacterium]
MEAEQAKDNESALLHQLLYQNTVTTPVGHLRLAGSIRNGRGILPVRPLRVYGSYAVMCLLRGTGHYRDINGRRVDLKAGDAVLVFPELAHWYGPGRTTPTWDEFYITFDGPMFDQWRDAGLLEPENPVLRADVPAIKAWAEQVQHLLERQTLTIKERARQTADFATLLGDLLRVSESVSSGRGAAILCPSVPWLIQAERMLQTDLGRDLPLAEVAATVNMSYETFRKGFREATGTTPAHYRARYRIEAAKALIRYRSGITNREIAETLGFADEFHFSRRFTQITGVTPRAFRQQRNKSDDSAL